MNRAIQTMRQAVKAGTGRFSWRAVGLLAIAVAVFGALGDSGVRSATSTGRDPLDLLDLQVKPNLAILFDTSGSMKYTTINPPGFYMVPVGGDDTKSRMYQAKLALSEVLAANAGKMNFGMASFIVPARQKSLNRNQATINSTGPYNRDDGPLIYVSRDANAELFYFRNADGDANLYETRAFTDATKGDTFVCNNDTTRKYAGFFCNIDNTRANYDDNVASTTAPTTAVSQAIYKSFGNAGVYAVPYPENGTWDQTVALTIPGTPADDCPQGTATGSWKCTKRRPICTAGTDCRYYLQSRVYRNGKKYTWNRSANTETTRLTRVDAITCPAPPAGLVGWTVAPPCFQFADSVTGATATFYYTSAIFESVGTAPNSCNGALMLANVAGCAESTPAVVFQALRPELPLTSTGAITDLVENVVPSAPDLLAGLYPGVPSTQPDPGLGNVGLRSDGLTPIGNSLNGFRTAATPVFPVAPTDLPAGARQKNFVMVLTDGDDTCTTPADAALQANRLYYQGGYSPTTPSTDPRHQAETLVVAFADAVALTQAHNIAKAGSGGTSTNGFSTVTCPAGVPCRNAFAATNLDELRTALQEAFALITSDGHFADRSAVDTVYEYGGAVLNPTNRYRTLVPLLVQSSWDLPGFQGRLKAFLNVSGAAALQWDAGVQLQARITGNLATVTHPFADLPALINRRIFTSTLLNGANGNYTAPNLVSNAGGLAADRVMLWPPQATVLNGDYDTALGIPTTFADLQTEFGACVAATGFTFPGTHACVSAAAPTKLARAKLEARQMILAYMAGAEVQRTGGAPTRVTATGDPLYLGRSWLLADATVAAPAIASPPPLGTAGFHATEYNRYATGLRTGSGVGVNGLSAGFGLTAPDADGKPASAADNALKPVMTVVYHAANDMLHAFRAGPCAAGSCAGETGGEELWGFVPNDQLGKLKTRLLTPQKRDPHTYMMAAPVRLADVFVPGSITGNVGGVDISGEGVWRLVLFVGRGPGGKYLSALDVTTPGPTTIAATATALPTVMWNRTHVGMGETWSVPAVGPVDPALWGGAEYVAFVGSGYSDVVDEGRTFYALNALTGAIIASHSFDLGPGSGTVKNALVASPSLFQPNLLSFNPAGTGPPMGATDRGTLVYFGDVAGRIFRYNTATPADPPVVFADRGPAQPFGVPVALLNADSNGGAKPHVFAVTGADMRVPATNPFELMGLRDNSTAEETFRLNFASGYRGTVQPAAAYDEDGIGIAIMVGTKFTPATTQCVSQFDSVMYIVEAGDGAAAYDLPDEGGRAVYFGKEKITDLRISGGSPSLTQGLGADVPLPPQTAIAAVEPEKTISIGPPDGRPLPGTTSFKVGSSVWSSCR